MDQMDTMVASDGFPEKFSFQKSRLVHVVPAAKTPTCLFPLSNLDQPLQYPMEVLLAFYGDDNNNNHNATDIIKTALAKTLVEFYPVAGCLVRGLDGKISVSCPGNGVPFVEAVSENEMMVLGDISTLDPNLRKLFVHSQLIETAQSILDIPPLTVQVTRFKCGGIVLGVIGNHMIFDGISFANFLISLSEVARGLPLSLTPYLDRSILPPRQPPRINFPHHEYTNQEQALTGSTLGSFRQTDKCSLVCRSFSFDPDTIVQLRKLAAFREGHRLSFVPTNFELISALVWINRTKALNIKPEMESKLITAVNGRSKLNPPLPKGYFGNAIVCSCAQSKAGELTTRPYSFAVELVHKANMAVDEEYIRSAIDYVELTRQLAYSHENTMSVTKWTSIPFYDMDFGWGQPMQVTPVSPVEDVVVFLPYGKKSNNIMITLTLPSASLEVFQDLMAQATCTSYHGNLPTANKSNGPTQQLRKSRI